MSEKYSLFCCRSAHKWVLSVLGSVHIYILHADKATSVEGIAGKKRPKEKDETEYEGSPSAKRLSLAPEKRDCVTESLSTDKEVSRNDDTLHILVYGKRETITASSHIIYVCVCLSVGGS